MRFIILLLAFVGFVFESFGRPQQSIANEGDVEKAEYEGNEELASEDYLNDKSAEESLREVNVEDKLYNPRKSATQHDADSRVSYAHLPQNSNHYENLLDHEPESRKIHRGDNHASEEEMSSLSDRRQLNPNLDNEEVEEKEETIQQPLIDTRSHHIKRNNENNNPKSEESILSSNEDENNFYEDDPRQINDRSEYNNEPIETTRQSPLLKHRLFNNKDDSLMKRTANGIFIGNRDRRHISVDQHPKEIMDNIKIMAKKEETEISNEDNESAIKRNIKKLSREELEDLLNSLSDDKKALLKKIIDTKLEGVNKREITKKAGAVEENNCLESGQSDLSKMEGGGSMDSSSSVSPGDTTDSTKHTEVNEVSSSKNSESEKSSAKAEGKDELIDENLSLMKEPTLEDEEHNKESKGDLNIQEAAKNENKREINSDNSSEDKSDIDNDEILEETQYAPLGNDMGCAKDDSWSELMKDESELHKAYSSLYKRGVDNNVNSANIQSLEESFPNYDYVDSKSSDSQMAPLIRVKRTNSNQIKRGTDHCVNMKVPFFSRALNDEIDDNEKSEFDDGGIFERASNYEKIGKDNRQFKTELENNNDRIESSNSFKNRSQSKNYLKIKTEPDTANIGSDTDNILSNIEGVDDNLMYNNGLRKKRFADDSNLNDELVNIENNELTPKSPSAFISNEKTNDLTQNSYNIANCQESDAISHSPDVELGRYKRIRRLKPSSVLKNMEIN